MLLLRPNPITRASIVVVLFIMIGIERLSFLVQVHLKRITLGVLSQAHSTLYRKNGQNLYCREFSRKHFMFNNIFRINNQLWRYKQKSDFGTSKPPRPFYNRTDRRDFQCDILGVKQDTVVNSFELIFFFLQGGSPLGPQDSGPLAHCPIL